MRIHSPAIGMTVAAYIAATELLVQGEKAVPHAEFGCTSANPVVSLLGGLVMLRVAAGSSGWIARRAGRRWIITTALHAAVSAGAAALLGRQYYRVRSVQAAECSELPVCVRCMMSVWEMAWFQVGFAAVLAVALGVAAGLAARDRGFHGPPEEPEPGI